MPNSLPTTKFTVQVTFSDGKDHVLFSHLHGDEAMARAEYVTITMSGVVGLGCRAELIVHDELSSRIVASMGVVE